MGVQQLGEPLIFISFHPTLREHGRPIGYDCFKADVGSITSIERTGAYLCSRSEISFACHLSTSQVKSGSTAQTSTGPALSSSVPLVCV